MRVFHFLLIFIVFAGSCKNKLDTMNLPFLTDNDSSDVQQSGNHQLVDLSDKTWTRWYEQDKMGNPFITNFPLEENVDYQNWAILQDDYGMMLFANRRGILTFDGAKWSVIKTNGFPITMEKDLKTGRIIVGCNDGFGLLVRDDENLYIYESYAINQDEEDAEVTDIICTDKSYYFYNDTHIIATSTDDFEVQTTWKAPENQMFTGFFKHAGMLYVNSTNGLYKLVPNGKLEAIRITFPKQVPATIDTTIAQPLDNFDLNSQAILFALPINAKFSLLGTSDSELLLFDGSALFSYAVINKEYLKQSILSGGLDLSQNEFALATINGGCIVISKKTGKTIVIVNYQTGLPDDEIYALGKDNNHGLWLSHGFGISRVNFSLPIKNYNTYLGLEGGILSLTSFANTVYVATTLGVYYLDEVTDYQQVEVLNRPSRKTNRDNDGESNNQSNEQETNNSANETNTPIETTERKTTVVVDNNAETENILDRWKDKWKKKKDENRRLEAMRIAEKMKELDHPADDKTVKPDVAVNDNTATEVKTDNTNKPKEVNNKPTNDQSKEKKVKHSTYNAVVKKTVTQKTIYHIYKKVEGLDEKCKQIISYNDKLLVATNTGLYEIKNKIVSPIIKGIYVNCISQSRDADKLFIGTSKGIVSITLIKQPNKKEQWVAEKIEGAENFNQSVYSLCEDNKHRLWMGSEDVTYILILDSVGATPKPYMFYNDFPERINVREINGEPIFFLKSGIYGFNAANDIIFKQPLHPDYVPNSKFIFSQNDLTWISKNNRWIAVGNKADKINFKYDLLNMFDDIQFIFVDNTNNIWLIDANNQLFKILPVAEYAKHIFNININKVSDFEGAVYPMANLSLDSERNSIAFELSAPFYLKLSSTLYQFKLEGISDKWSKWEVKPEIKFPYLPAGQYTLNVRAKNILNEVNDMESYHFTVKPPFWKTWWFYSIITILSLGLIYSTMKIRERNLRDAKNLLEQKVLERTAEIQKQREQMRDSIQYASRIQSAILPPHSYINEILPDFFIMYKPKDIVSGDYYWISEKNGRVVVNVADCTGHGVPGAFLSVLGITSLNDIVNKQGITQANEILNLLRDSLTNSLHQTGQKGEAHDGMDMAMCVIDSENMELQFSGAYNPLYVIRLLSEAPVETSEMALNKHYKYSVHEQANKFYEFIELRPDRMPVGVYYKQHRPFTNHIFKIQKGDSLYIFSDGYLDQFGGDDGRKFLSSQFKKLLLAVQDNSMVEQKAILENTLITWKGVFNQIDDITVMGIRI